MTTTTLYSGFTDGTLYKTLTYTSSDSALVNCAPHSWDDVIFYCDDSETVPGLSVSSCESSSITINKYWDRSDYDVVK